MRRIRGVSGLTRAAIRRLEDERLAPDTVFWALAGCRRYLDQPGRALPEPEVGCDPCNPVLARDELEAVLRWLPRGARTDLGRLVARLDAEFDRRSTPMPWLRMPDSPQGIDGWWRRRLQVPDRSW
ncbi:hypothetical protein ACIRVF_38480 [Kitasatospora sp. NPDC101157]|uniref:hypothetical protein n=1 Tax=Kitasatospora sp. NPDC101157 TaxID=3364098 RepID=UPI003810A94A